MYGGGEPGKEQVKNYLLAEGFRRSVGNSNAMHLCIRYSAQSERLYRRSVQDFDRIRVLGGPGGASGAAGGSACQSRRGRSPATIRDRPPLRPRAVGFVVPPSPAAPRG
jgi:hypothetical protein